MSRFLVVLLLVCGAAFAAPPDNRPPDNRPPDRGRPTPPAPGPTTATSGATAGAEANQSQQQSIVNNNSLFGANGGVDGQSASGFDGLLSPSATGSSGDIRYNSESDYFSLSVGAANIDGCMTGKGIGGGGNGGGGWVNWAGLNVVCFLNEMAQAERHVAVRSRLKCAAKPFREAMVFDHKGLNKAERIQACIDFVVPIWLSEIDYLKQLATDRLEDSAGIKGGMLLAENSTAQLNELKTAIAVLRSELDNERESITEQRQELKVEQQQVQQQQQQAEAYVATRVSKGEIRRAESRAYLEQSQAIKLEVSKDGPEE